MRRPHGRRALLLLLLLLCLVVLLVVMVVLLMRLWLGVRGVAFAVRSHPPITAVVRLLLLVVWVLLHVMLRLM